MGKGSRGKRLLRAGLVVLGVGFVAALGLFAMAWAMTPIPDSTQDGATAQGSVIYYRDGKTVLAKQGVNRRTVSLEKVPESLRNAVIAAENRSFYTDSGVSLRGTARAVWSTVTGKQLQGGSTITQQMVRNYYSGLSQERSAVRKLKEIMISLKVDRSQSKDWVLEQYLNTIYFGRGAHGVQAAADAYFRKDVSKLTLAESAYLASVIQQPTRFAEPKGADLDAVRARWQWVIDGMVQTGALSADEAAEVRFPKLKEPREVFTPKGQEGYMLDQVMTELAQMGYTREIVNQGGLKIVTTFDRKLMAAAEQAVDSVLPEDAPKKVRTGLAAVAPDTGEVLAFYGGRSYAANKYDNAFSAKVQAGSTFKAYALAAALEDGRFTLDTRVEGNSPMRVASAPKGIPNSGGVSYGQVNLIKAMRHSVNTAFVDLGQQVGLDRVARAAESAGIPAAQLTPHQGAATLPLGVASVSAVQNASGYATFAAEGVYRKPHVIRSVKDADGTDKMTDKGVQAFSKQTAADVTYTLTKVVNGGTGTAARLYDRPAAGKTGTTDKSAAAWFTGYTPQLSVAVNMFRDDNKPVVVGGSVQYGGQYPAQIWRAFMAEAMAGKPVEQFPEPSTRGYSPPPHGYDPFPDQNGDYGGDEYIAPTPDPEPTPVPSPEATEEPVPEVTVVPTPDVTVIPTPDDPGDGDIEVDDGGNGGGGGNGGNVDTDIPADRTGRAAEFRVAG
ncbi:hypothetical protein GCM10010156_55700 [Planobispora rosea]|uniref:Penicillin-insensitive transglycosylase n=1 Tax=Planobispora rosea TaxID=35762 RepID=A0A8J3WEG1_PLARO|nr:transglycosylase domain-containing protein [Planobispora rosea]GGS90188.1 hypothetical protein GCM10010156_55700 [Planobispora rosea]GIH86944.1 hypothetical protein Pro02_53520 [Planobispora rosea]